MAIGWIRVDSVMPQHTKVKRLARKLGDPSEEGRTLACGILLRLWCWAARLAEDGVVSKYEPEEVADEVGWSRDPEELMGALIESGWIDETPEGPVIHDWDELQGALVERKEKAKQRMRELRARRKRERDVGREPSADIGEPSDYPDDALRERSRTFLERDDHRVRARTPSRSVSSRFVSSRHGGETEGSERAELGDADEELSAFDRLWEVYPRKQRKRQAEATWNDVRDEAPPIQDLVDAVKLWRRTEQWTAEGGRYVPLLHKWLREQRWLEPPVITGPHFEQIPQEEIRAVLGRLEESLDWRNA